MYRHAVIVLSVCALFVWGCKRSSSVSKIPQIAITQVLPLDSMHANIDTCSIEFTITDGDGDIGSTYTGDTSSAIYLKDSRYDSAGFVMNYFPVVDPTVEDPTEGLQASCILFPIPQPVPRSDTPHMHSDTLHYEFYVTDRAGHKSNHLITHNIIVKSP